MRLISYLMLSILLIGVSGGFSGSAAQDAPPVTYQRYDVTFDVQPDGTFLVRETQQIRFDGEFRQAFAEIPLAYTTRIDNVAVYEDDIAYQAGGEGPGTFVTQYDGDHLYVDWTFEPTQPGDVRTFTLAYTVVGGLWVYPSDDPATGPGQALLEWRAVPADRSGVPVLNNQVTVTLPPDPATGQPVPAGDLQAASFGHEADFQIDDGRVTFTGQGAIPDGVALQVQVAFPDRIVQAQPQPWQVAEDTANLVYRYRSLDTDLSINADGSVDVQERHRIAVEAGALRQGVRTIRHTGMDDVVDVAVLEGEQVYTRLQELCDECYQVTQTPRSPGWVVYDPYYGAVTTDEQLAGSTEILWQTPALVKGEETTFRLDYTLVGAVRVEEESQTFQWTIVFDEQNVPVESASVRINLPPGLEPSDVQVSGGAVETQADGSLLLTPKGPITSYAPWTFTVVMPANATSAAKPQWQQDVEAATREAQRAEAQRARLQLLMGGLAMLILTGGLLSLLLIWYRRGRDEPVPLPAEYIVEPPSDLPPGIVAYLLDEKPSSKGALAALFHLATLGLLRIQLTPELRVQRNWNETLSEGQTIETPDGRTVTIPGHLAKLFNELFSAIPLDTARPLDRIMPLFQAALPAVYARMTAEVGPLFDQTPYKARMRWRQFGRGLVLLAGLVLFAGCLWSREIGPVALTPGLALAVVGGAWVLASRWMPQRTPKGALEAAKWRAFRRYLLNLEEYGNLAEAQQILDRYFAYGVAMNVEEVVLRDAERLQAHTPVWTRPITVSSGGSQPGSSPELRPLQTQPVATAGAAPAATPDLSLSGLSRQMARNLSLASIHLGQTLRMAAGDGSSTMETLGKTLRSSSGSSGGSFSSSRSSWSSGSSRSSSFSRSSSSSSSRSSSSRSSGGGGSRGFR